MGKEGAVRVGSALCLQDQHRVAKAVEAVPLPLGFLIRGQYPFAAAITPTRRFGAACRKGAHQHQQAGAGQVEIGDQRVDDPELEGRIDVEVADPAKGSNRPPRAR